MQCNCGGTMNKVRDEIYRCKKCDKWYLNEREEKDATVVDMVEGS